MATDVSEFSWYRVHPDFGCHPIDDDDVVLEPSPAVNPQVSSAWFDLEPELRSAVEYNFFSRCLDRAVSHGSVAWVEGDGLTPPDYEFVSLGGPLEDRRVELFTAVECSFKIVVDRIPVYFGRYYWEFATARLSDEDVDVLAPWASNDVELTHIPDTGLDRVEARDVAEEHLGRIRGLTWTQLLDERPEQVAHVGRSGTRYSVAIDVWWEAPFLGRVRRRGDVMAQVTVDVGGLSVLFPVVASFVRAPDGALRRT